jgi:Cdc25 family phosphatase
MRSRPESPTKKQKRFLALPTFVDPEQVVSLLLNPSFVSQRDYAIIDVRTDDFAGGNIVGCINIPISRFEYDIQGIFQELRHIPALYFHCQLSQVRGPKAAQKYVNYINQSEEHHAQEIFIVRGGYSEFQNVAGTDKRLLENVSYGY